MEIVKTTSNAPSYSVNALMINGKFVKYKKNTPIKPKITLKIMLSLRDRLLFEVDI